MWKLTGAKYPNTTFLLRKTPPLYDRTAPDSNHLHAVPVAVKTTALARSFDHFGKLGYCVVIVPEAATLLINAGIAPRALTDSTPFQKTILKLTLALETEIELLARKCADKPVLMICDRGALDGKAYCSQAQWENVLADEMFTELIAAS